MPPKEAISPSVGRPITNRRVPPPCSVTESLTAVSAGIGQNLCCCPPLCCTGSSKRRRAQPEASGGDRPRLLLLVRRFDRGINGATPFSRSLVRRGTVRVFHHLRPQRTGARVCLFRRAGAAISGHRSGRLVHWVKVKNPKAPAVRREAEEDWR